MATTQPPEKEQAYPEPTMFGDLPATGFFVRHAKNLEMSNVEIATAAPDSRPAFTMIDVDGADLFRVRVPKPANAPVFALKQVSNFRVFGSPFVPDKHVLQADNEAF
jgi:hypothetical protein